MIRFRIDQRLRLQIPGLEAEVFGGRVEEVAGGGGLQALASVVVTIKAKIKQRGKY